MTDKTINCRTCGPMATEPHPRLPIDRCSNCKEHITPAPDADRREQYAAAIPVRGFSEESHAYANRVADAVIAVADREQQQLRERAEEAERRVRNLQSSYASLLEMSRGWSERGIENGKRAEKAEAQLAGVKEWLPVLRRAIDCLDTTCRYHGDQLDPDRFGRMTRSEACCDTGVEPRRAREARLALAALAQSAAPEETEPQPYTVEVWPLARVLTDVRCGSEDWTWEEEWADLDARHAASGYLDRLEQQIRANGITMPVLIGTDGRLWDGHHRLRIAVRLGIGYIPVEVPAALDQSAAPADTRPGKEA
ncbi:ParB N-terminal domain-containing protein [Streptomyces sp. NPDC056437]|uniref:ParB N-terminal domain-containing protein n=1 Tax=Streptomyces sp. NPDC056437 TaxID=3345816 RepID=UPI0036C1E04C